MTTEQLPEQPAEPITGFYGHEQLGTDILEAAHPHRPVTDPVVGQRVIAAQWYFTITAVDATTLEGRTDTLIMWGCKRDDGTWRSMAFGNSKAVLNAEF